MYNSSDLCSNKALDLIETYTLPNEAPDFNEANSYLYKAPCPIEAGKCLEQTLYLNETFAPDKAHGFNEVMSFSIPRP
ncbi:hypothetical protein DPMN_037775 [Dreissena polymorpha]|uniref:Uncharacterized protein n=1 Tax=Dreissena polymorpha TaxID=45954 RepID=A0A9D4RQ39_DREPO|nr:hypothetical protein DPMN_037775 [Dreissena polymorpha]